VKKVCVVAALSALMVSGGAVAPFAQEASVLVKTELPQQGEMPDLVTAFGTLGPAVDGGMTLSVQHEGRVLELSVMAGQQVHKGDKLVTFGASAAVASSYEQALNALKLARSQKLHADQLLSQQLATRDQVAQADKAVLDAQTALDALQKQGAAQPVEVLTAPFDGVVTTRSTDIGALIASTGGPTDVALFTVADQRRLRVYVRVPQNYSALVAKGMAAELTVPEYAGQTFKAVVVGGANAVGAQSGAELVELQLDNADGKIKSGDYAQVTFHLTSAANTTRIPATASKPAPPSLSA